MSEWEIQQDERLQGWVCENYSQEMKTTVDGLMADSPNDTKSDEIKQVVHATRMLATKGFFQCIPTPTRVSDRSSGEGGGVSSPGLLFCGRHTHIHAIFGHFGAFSRTYRGVRQESLSWGNQGAHGVYEPFPFVWPFGVGFGRAPPNLAPPPRAHR